VYKRPSLTVDGLTFCPLSLSPISTTAALDKPNGNYRINCHNSMSIHRLTHDSALPQEANVI